ncbi:squalene/phytoene synthase family protein [Acetobacter syzygii]|uniref:squalene/phytoene synthase family protein n=1 Tax=Acetobacter syzygii TaxID=146476 RepID=UPI00156EEB93|nr:squalene/phytoene synthase family protein [Acetobacter syzygii]NSL93273.1 phytoene synthase [Acetobacter syzygii]
MKDHSLQGDMQALARLAAADPDRVLCARFLPAFAQQGALVLLAFHNELIRALLPARSAAVAGPMAGLIRLQWWRDVLERTRPPEHALAPYVLDMMERGQVGQATLLRLVQSCEVELAGGRDLLAWQGMMQDGAGALQRATGELLGVEDTSALQQLELCGMAYGAGAMLRHWPALQQSGRFICPEGAATLRQQGQVWLEAAGWSQLSSPLRLLGLPAVLARRDLARKASQAEQPRGLGDRAAVAWQGLKALRAFDRS